MKVLWSGDGGGAIRVAHHQVAIHWRNDASIALRCRPNSLGVSAGTEDDRASGGGGERGAEARHRL
eukprot:9381076-Alexandrium_andersonii.AAC.2